MIHEREGILLKIIEMANGNTRAHVMCGVLLWGIVRWDCSADQSAGVATLASPMGKDIYCYHTPAQGPLGYPRYC